MAHRGPASNAVAMFSGDARPFGFAIDNAGGVWQIRDFTVGVSWGADATVTIDFAQWQQVLP
jgi:hypothetical protein